MCQRTYPAVVRWLNIIINDQRSVQTNNRGKKQSIFTATKSIKREADYFILSWIIAVNTVCGQKLYIISLFYEGLHTLLARQIFPYKIHEISAKIPHITHNLLILVQGCYGITKTRNSGLVNKAIISGVV